MEFEKAGEHTYDSSLIPTGHPANILDLGCRGFDIKDHLPFTNHFVFSIDIDELNTNGEYYPYYRIAISDRNGMSGVQRMLDKQATHITEGDEIPMMTIEVFSKMVGVKHWDMIKMDIEGQEIKVLESAKHPLAKQVSVEFHAHCGNQTKEQLDALLGKLSEYYTIHNNVWESRHGAGFNYWDVLLISK